MTLSAIVFDADNKPINNVNVLFITPVGEVIPLTATTKQVGNQQGTAQTTLQVPAGAPVLQDNVGNILWLTDTARRQALRRAREHRLALVIGHAGPEQRTNSAAISSEWTHRGHRRFNAIDPDLALGG